MHFRSETLASDESPIGYGSRLDGLVQTIDRIVGTINEVSSNTDQIKKDIHRCAENPHNSIAIVPAQPHGLAGALLRCERT
jgi:hypothetical protein